MMIKTLLTAAAAMALISGAAQAQTTKTKPKPAAPAASSQTHEDMSAAPKGDTSPSMSHDTSVNPPASAERSGVNASTTVASSNAVTNGPVADTPENRAKYRPLSRAGRHTAPRGN